MGNLSSNKAQIRIQLKDDWYDLDLAPGKTFYVHF